MSDQATNRRLFYRQGECFIGDMDAAGKTATGVKLVRFNDEGDILAVDAGMGLIGKDAVWDLETMSVPVKGNICVSPEEEEARTPRVLQFPSTKEESTINA